MKEQWFSIFSLEIKKELRSGKLFLQYQSNDNIPLETISRHLTNQIVKLGSESTKLRVECERLQYVRNMVDKL